LRNFLKKIWDFLDSCSCPSTLDPLERFEELPEKDLGLPGFLLLPFLEMIWHFLDSCSCPSTLDTKKAFKALLEMIWHSLEMIWHFLEMIWHFLEMIWHFLDSCSCPSTLDPLKKIFQEVPQIFSWDPELKGRNKNLESGATGTGKGHIDVAASRAEEFPVRHGGHFRPPPSTSMCSNCTHSHAPIAAHTFGRKHAHNV
jgi:hypothetical protein